MASKSTAMEISAICGLFILLALWGIVWDITSGLLTSGIDGIMLLFVCAMMAGIFSLIILMELTKSGIIPTPAFLRPAPKPAAAAKPAATAAAAKPANPASPGATTTPGTPPTAPRPAAPVPSAAGAPAPAKPATAVPAEPPTVPEK